MRRHLFSVFVTLLLTTCITLPAQAKVTMPAIFTDNMVVQRDQPVNIWGWADKGETVEVIFNGQKKKAKAAKDGTWRLQLKPMAYGGPFEMTIIGKGNVIQLQNILIGEVWLCSGQSNMEWTVNSSNNASEEIAQASYPMIRSFNVTREVSITPKSDLNGKWEVCSPETVANFSAVGYYFARNLYQELDIPIGFINSSWGGTDIETWTSGDAFSKLPEQFSNRYQKIDNFDEFIRNNEEGKQKYQKALQNERGIPEGWYKADYDKSSWEVINVPGLWEGTLGAVDGYVWFSCDFELPSELAGNAAKISLAAIDDADITWVNGAKVGETNGHAIVREYNIPQGLLKAGKNTVAVRVLDTGGGGGIHGNANDMYLSVAGNRLPLAGNWKYKSSVINTDFGYVEMSPNMLPTLLYNAMINPIISFGIKGSIWYQGENNAWAAYNYRTLFPTMINAWRAKWGYDFPFYWVQLANFMQKEKEPGDSDWAKLREAQTMTLSLPKTGQAVITDIGDADDIHPRNKQDVGRRLALIALNKDYGKDVVYSGPTYKSMQVSGDKAIITFDNVSGGLNVKSKYGYIEGFAIAGADKKFYWSKAYQDGDKVVVYSDKVKNPVAVRFGWSNNPDINLYNDAGLPACPFRTDDW